MQTRTCDVCGVRNSKDKKVEKDGSGKYSCPEHWEDKRAATPQGTILLDKVGFAAFESRLKKVEAFIPSVSELAIGATIQAVVADEMKLRGLDTDALKNFISEIAKSEIKAAAKK